LPKGQAKHYCGSNEQQAEISRQGEGHSQLEEFESPILFLSTGIRRPVRNDVLIDLYAFDPAGISLTRFTKLPMSFPILPS
jgi:hypothetical protein